MDLGSNCNTYFYCPKEDPYHRVNWKDDYPVGWIEDFREFKSNADRAGIDIIFGISPGASLELKDFEYLERKIEIFKELSIENFCILFDDIPKEKEQFYLLLSIKLQHHIYVLKKEKKI